MRKDVKLLSTIKLSERFNPESGDELCFYANAI